MSIGLVLETTLDVHIAKTTGVVTCGFCPNQDVKRRCFSSAKVRLLETAQANQSGIHGARLSLQITFLKTKKPVLVPLSDTATLVRVCKPKYCLLVSTEAKGLRVRLASQSETECQRLTSTLLRVMSSRSLSTGRSQRLSLCLSNYLFSILDSRQANACGLFGFDYWAVLDKDIGLTLFPAVRRAMMSKSAGEDSGASVSFQFEQIARVELVTAANTIDDGKLLQILLVASRPSAKDGLNSVKAPHSDKKATGANMTRRWGHKSPKKSVHGQDASTSRPLTPTTILGYHTLSLFCPDAKKFVEDWKTYQKANGSNKPNVPGDPPGSRRSSASHCSQSSSSNSHCNMSALNSLLRRSLPSLNNASSPSSSGQNSGSPPVSNHGNQAPPLPSRRELEQRESDRLLERQLRRQIKYDEMDKTSDSSQEDHELQTPTPRNHGQYKLLPADPIPVMNMEIPPESPPPLPPKNDPGRKRGFETPKVVKSAANGRRDIPTHYKLLIFGEELFDGHNPHYEPVSPPPLPPRRHQNSDSSVLPSPTTDRPNVDGYKKLTFSGAGAVEYESSKRQTGVGHWQRHNKILETYNRLPEPVPAVLHQRDDNGVRRSLETEV